MITIEVLRNMPPRVTMARICFEHRELHPFVQMMLIGPWASVRGRGLKEL